MPSADRIAARDADFYLLERSLEPAGRRLLGQVREYLEKSVQPVINHYWTREEAIYSYEGTREINTLIVGRAITGLSAFV
jgi:glutaryl-CoA dehydrogenase